MATASYARAELNLLLVIRIEDVFEAGSDACLVMHLHRDSGIIEEYHSCIESTAFVQDVRVTTYARTMEIASGPKDRVLHPCGSLDTAVGKNPCG